jgi:YHS domain-containing protein
MVMDPVCQMEFDEETAQWKFEYRGQTYYFCAPGCKASFVKDPEKYLGGSEEGHEHHHH